MIPFPWRAWIGSGFRHSPEQHIWPVQEHCYEKVFEKKRYSCRNSKRNPEMSSCRQKMMSENRFLDFRIRFFILKLVFEIRRLSNFQLKRGARFKNLGKNNREKPASERRASEQTFSKFWTLRASASGTFWNFRRASEGERSLARPQLARSLALRIFRTLGEPVGICLFLRF